MRRKPTNLIGREPFEILPVEVAGIDALTQFHEIGVDVVRVRAVALR